MAYFLDFDVYVVMTLIVPGIRGNAPIVIKTQPNCLPGQACKNRTGGKYGEIVKPRGNLRRAGGKHTIISLTGNEFKFYLLKLRCACT